ncbi:MAG: hypothetical protein WCL32_10055 [Planctomycetota bacterium]
MPKALLIEEFHISLLVPRRVSAKDGAAIRRTFRTAKFERRLPGRRRCDSQVLHAPHRETGRFTVTGGGEGRVRQARGSTPGLPLSFSRQAANRAEKLESSPWLTSGPGEISQAFGASVEVTDAGSAGAELPSVRRNRRSQIVRQRLPQLGVFGVQVAPMILPWWPWPTAIPDGMLSPSVTVVTFFALPSAPISMTLAQSCPGGLLRVFDSFRHLEAALFVDVHRDRIDQVGFAGDELDREAFGTVIALTASCGLSAGPAGFDCPRGMTSLDFFGPS